MLSYVPKPASIRKTDFAGGEVAYVLLLKALQAGLQDFFLL